MTTLYVLLAICSITLPFIYLSKRRESMHTELMYDIGKRCYWNQGAFEYKGVRYITKKSIQNLFTSIHLELGMTPKGAEWYSDELYKKYYNDSLYSKIQYTNNFSRKEINY